MAINSNRFPLQNAIKKILDAPNSRPVLPALEDDSSVEEGLIVRDDKFGKAERYDYLKRLGSGVFLGVSLTIGTAFYATPPANAQPLRDADCALHAVGYAAGGVHIDLVSEITGAMAGPTHDADVITDMIHIMGRGRTGYRGFPSLDTFEAYLRSQGDAEYIVGWQGYGDPRGHVVNARTIGDTIIYIDNQCQRFTQPPIGGTYNYYAWFIGHINFGNDRGDPMDLDKRDVKTGSGRFTESCRNINLFTNIDRNNSVSLSAECRNELGNFTPTAIDLNDSIINDFGGLVWQDNGGFGASVRNCRLRHENITVLQCEAGDGNGSWKKAAITLDKKIVNDNGRLTVKLSPPRF
jgi:CVNH domain